MSVEISVNLSFFIPDDEAKEKIGDKTIDDFVEDLFLELLAKENMELNYVEVDYFSEEKTPIEE